MLVVEAAAESTRTPTRYRAEDMILAVEVMSPDSEERDRETKSHKYATAGIPHHRRVGMAGEDQRPVVYVYELDPMTSPHALTGIHTTG